MSHEYSCDGEKTDCWDVHALLYENMTLNTGPPKNHRLIKHCVQFKQVINLPAGTV